mgnify:CR=1 FL=1
MTSKLYEITGNFGTVEISMKRYVVQNVTDAFYFAIMDGLTRFRKYKRMPIEKNSEMLEDKLNDKIAAISNALGVGGIGIVRLSGPQALAISDKVFVCSSGAKPSEFKSHTTHYGKIT